MTTSVPADDSGRVRTEPRGPACIPSTPPTPARARRNLLVGGIALAVAAVLFVIAVPLGIRGHGVAHLEVVGEAPASAVAAGAEEQTGAVELRTAPVTRAASSTT